MDPEIVEQFNMLMDSDDDRDADVKYQIALCYLKGEGVEADPQLAETYLRDAAQLGSEEAAALLQRQTAPQRRAPVTAETFPDDCRLAEEGDIEAQYAVAHYLLTQDPQHAAQDADVMRYLLSAADQGNADACLELARLLRPTKPEEALQYYTNAADVSAEACRELAICLAEGIGTAPDPARAEGYFVRAATAGSAEEKLELAKRYSMGWGVPKSVVKANSWLRQAELAGIANARERIEAELAQARAAAEAEQAARRRAEEKRRQLREAEAEAERHRLAAEEAMERARAVKETAAKEAAEKWRERRKRLIAVLVFLVVVIFSGTRSYSNNQLKKAAPIADSIISEYMEGNYEKADTLYRANKGRYLKKAVKKNIFESSCCESAMERYRDALQEVVSRFNSKDVSGFELLRSSISELELAHSVARGCGFTGLGTLDDAVKDAGKLRKALDLIADEDLSKAQKLLQSIGEDADSYACAQACVQFSNSLWGDIDACNKATEEENYRVALSLAESLDVCFNTKAQTERYERAVLGRTQQLGEAGDSVAALSCIREHCLVHPESKALAECYCKWLLSSTEGAEQDAAKFAILLENLLPTAQQERALVDRAAAALEQWGNDAVQAGDPSRAFGYAKTVFSAMPDDKRIGALYDRFSPTFLCDLETSASGAVSRVEGGITGGDGVLYDSDNLYRLDTGTTTYQLNGQFSHFHVQVLPAASDYQHDWGFPGSSMTLLVDGEAWITGEGIDSNTEGGVWDVSLEQAMTLTFTYERTENLWGQTSPELLLIGPELY